LYKISFVNKLTGFPLLYMFNFFRSKSSPFLIGEVLQTDMHSHLIPGIDDGSPDLETSIQLILELKNMGYQKLITTPHTMLGLYNNNSKIIKEGLKKVKNELKKRKISIELEAASEYFIDPHFEELIEKDDVLSFGKEKYVLVEMSFVAASMNYENIIFELKTKGYTPILAHPERYTYWHNKPEKIEHIVDMGCLLQVNLLSLCGYYGRDTQKVATKLVKDNRSSFLGTDVHHKRHIDFLNTHNLSFIKEYTFLNSQI
jgi:protein-tyrosine phosphatase